MTNSTNVGIFVSSTGNTFTKNTSMGSTNFDLQSGPGEAENTFVKNKFGTTQFN